MPISSWWSDLAGFFPGSSGALELLLWSSGALTLWSCVCAVFVKATFARVAFRGRCRLNSIALCIFCIFCNLLSKVVVSEFIDLPVIFVFLVFIFLFFVPEIRPFDQHVA